jgi:hypothetical protein
MLPNAPVITQNDFKGSNLSDLTKKLTTSPQGGLSDIFMQSLQIQKLYKGNELTSTGAAFSDSSGTNRALAPFKIILTGTVGIIIMITAALSFTLASLAFVARLVILLFLLAFSPIWVAAMVIPQLGDYSKTLIGQLKSQLTFMPVYLLLMYIALRILSNSKIFGASYAGNLYQASAGSSAAWGNDFIVLAINFAMVIFMLNLPLVVAVKMGGMASSWIDTKKYGAEGIWGGIRGWARRNAYQGTISRGASAISRSEGLKDFASKSRVGALALKGIRGAASDYNKKLEGQVKARTDFAESLGHDQSVVNRWESRLRSIKHQLNTLPDTPANAAARAALNRDKDDTERIISERKNERKKQYMEAIDSRSVDTVWTKIARKDKKAAAKIQMDIYEGELKEQKDDLKDIKGDIKQLESAIRNNPAGPGVAAGIATAAQQSELTRLIGKRDRLQGEINVKEDNLALEKLDYSA